MINRSDVGDHNLKISLQFLNILKGLQNVLNKLFLTKTDDIINKISVCSTTDILDYL